MAPDRGRQPPDDGWLGRPLDDAWRAGQVKVAKGLLPPVEANQGIHRHLRSVAASL